MRNNTIHIIFFVYIFLCSVNAQASLSNQIGENVLVEFACDDFLTWDEEFDDILAILANADPSTSSMIPQPGDVAIKGLMQENIVEAFHDHNVQLEHESQNGFVSKYKEAKSYGKKKKYQKIKEAFYLLQQGTHLNVSEEDRISMERDAGQYNKILCTKKAYCQRIKEAHNCFKQGIHINLNQEDRARVEHDALIYQRNLDKKRASSKRKKESWELVKHKEHIKLSEQNRIQVEQDAHYYQKSLDNKKIMSQKKARIIEK